MIGNSAVGKTTLIKKISGMNCPLISKSTEYPFPSTSQNITTTLCINNKEYHCTFIELFANYIGLVANTNKRQCLRQLNLLIYVCRHDCFSCEEKEELKKYISFFHDAQNISALVITGCENHNDKERLNLVERFKSNENTKDIATSMKNGIYTVGFPDLTNCPRWSKEALESTAQKDISKIHELIENSYRTGNILYESSGCLIM